MQFENPNITWHGKQERIISIAFNPFNKSEFITGGSDFEYKGYLKVN